MDDYGYINARIRALRSDLLTQEAYEEMMSLPDVPGLCAYLERTAYGRALEGTSGPGSVTALEEGLKEAWSDAVSKIHQITGGRPREHLEILLGRWEVENIKAVLRAKEADIGVSEAMATVLPTGVFHGAAYAELARQPSVQAIVELLTAWRSPYARPLREALKTHREPGILEPLELALDHAYFEDSAARLKDGDQNARSLCGFMGLLIDRANLLSAFKILKEGVSSFADIPKYFIQGGPHVPIAVYQAVVRAQDLREAAEILKKTPYAGAVQGLEGSERGLPALVRFERGLERIILERARSLGSTDPLGIGLMIAYLFQKYHEVSNIRIIARTKAYGMFIEDVRSLLVVYP